MLYACIGASQARVLERRAEAMSGEFNSQEVANTLWAFATMGTKPGERMTVQVGRRTEAISGEFNSQQWEQNRFELSHIRGVQLSHFMIPMTPANSVVTN